MSVCLSACLTFSCLMWLPGDVTSTFPLPLPPQFDSCCLSLCLSVSHFLAQLFHFDLTLPVQLLHLLSLLFYHCSIPLHLSFSSLPFPTPSSSLFVRFISFQPRLSFCCGNEVRSDVSQSAVMNETVSTEAINHWPLILASDSWRKHLCWQCVDSMSLMTDTDMLRLT